ncbi:serine hydrolase [Subsaximicrobium wynnwilliamsii]|uniref:Serine hydrolase n=1 Tax=Subsaximicrobium wynnwilliamsii TaxID=291179 RepID=A0A5C6ZHB2_9FLAO|nr:serine hydrolase [Subsaximicrobium wynnwilliamsii]TXD83744.1 serine hydrolase [Subsaximicrobium wynnwilliamsii]TXD89373.1 serine hydrolase [Subsaximicrobium wynnwilliamsii]TXE03580.1 serine hydrolase [Subsaximicrobium wynnwilliamsii]
MNIKNYLALLLLVTCISLNAQIEEQKLDTLIEQTLSTFEVPGISVGILKDGKIVYAKGKGVRSLTSNKDMNATTLVGIASNSKGFTCVALAMMVDEGKLNWDDTVRKYIPEFQLHDAWVTKHFTIRDLVTHRSGLGLGAGDLMFFPENNSFSTEDILANLKYLEPESSFRSAFEYNNNMYIVAGEVLKRLSGLSWEEFIETRILKPVGMSSSKASYNRVTDKSNIIEAHTMADGKVIQIPHDWSDTANPAGGIVSNIPDMLTWAKFLMDGAVTAEGERLLSEKQLNELWQLQMPLKVSANDSYGSNFRGYGLGWFLTDVKGGHKQVYHTGGLLGTVTQFTMIPDMNLAIVVLTNQMNGSAFNSITNTIKDSYLGYDDRNWLKRLGDSNTNFITYNDSIKTAVYDEVKLAKTNKAFPKPEQIVGTYTDDWFGDIRISHNGNSYSISSKRSKTLIGELLPYNYSSFIAKWNNRSYDADVFVNFTFDETGKAIGARMKPIAPITDFSFDFEDLEFKRTK